MFHAWTTVIHPVGIVWGQTPASGPVLCLWGYLYTIVGVFPFQKKTRCGEGPRVIAAGGRSTWWGGGSLQGIGGHPLTMPSMNKQCTNWRHAAPRRWLEDPKDECPPGIGLSVGFQINRYFLTPCVVFGGIDAFGRSLGTFNFYLFTFLVFLTIQFFFSVCGAPRPRTRTQFPEGVASRPYDLFVLTPPDAKHLIHDGISD